MITPSFGLTATERVLPKLALDFTTASLDPRVTFTRSGSTATVVGSDGYIATINANLPRFDFDSVTLACKGLLIEEARTNLMLHSNAFATGWSIVAASSFTNASGTAPNNANEAALLIPAASATATINQSMPTTVAAYTYSVYAKPSGAGVNQFYLVSRDNPNENLALFTLSGAGTATKVGASVSAQSIKLEKNGWYRCVVTFTPTAAATNRYRITTAVGNGTDGILFFGGQMELGGFATSYIPTTTAAMTRNADVATMTGTNFSDWFNASQGTFMFQGVNYDVSSTKVMIDVTDGTLNERIQLSTGANKYFMADGGATQANFGTGSITANAVYKTVAAYKVNDLAFALNGAATQTDNTATLPTLNQMTIGTRAVFVNTNQYSGWLQKLNYYPQRLTNAEVQAFSK